MIRSSVAVACYALVVCVAASAAYGGPDDFRPPTPEELALKDIPYSPGAPAVVLDWHVFHDDTKSRAVEYVRIKILTDEGKKYGTVELLSIPGVRKIRGVDARTIAPDGTIVKFDGRTYDKVLIKRGRKKVLHKVFTLPNVTAGSILEYRYTIDWPERLIRSDSWLLQREIPIRRATFWIRPETRGIMSFCVPRRLPGHAAKRVRDRFEFAIENVPAFQPEPFSPPEAELKPRLDFFYGTGTPNLYWGDLAEALTQSIELFIGKRPAIKTQAESIIRDATSPAEKLRRLYTHVQQLHNRTYDQKKSEQEEQLANVPDNDNIEEVLRHRSGHAHELNRLFAGFARAAGFPAQIVLVSSRREMLFSAKVPDASQFSGEVVAVTVDGADLFLDPGTPFVPYGMLQWDNTLVPGLRLTGNGYYKWVTLPDQPPESATTSRTADLRMADGVLKGTVTMTYRGQEALTRRLDAMHEDEAANRTKLEDELRALLPDASDVKLKDVQRLTGPATLGDQPIVAEFEIEIPNAMTFSGSRTMIPLSIFEFNSKNPFFGAERRFSIDFEYQREIIDRVTLHLPEGHVLESMPKPVRNDIGGLTFLLTHTHRAGSVTADRQFTIRTVAVDSRYYNGVRKFYGACAAADQDPLVLKLSEK